VDGSTLETATLTIVLASAMTALDLCAAALWFWIAPATSTYADLDDIRQRARAADIDIPPGFDGWLQKTKGDNRYSYLRAFRHSHIHRLIRQDASVVTYDFGMARLLTIGADPAKPTTHERSQLLEEVANFVPERWSSWWPLFK
jgi:hypothetical protein